MSYGNRELSYQKTQSKRALRLQLSFKKNSKLQPVDIHIVKNFVVQLASLNVSNINIHGLNPLNPIILSAYQQKIFFDMYNL